MNKIFSILLVTLFASACATNSELQHVQKQVNSLQSQIAFTKQSTENTLKAVRKAAIIASYTEISARKAEAAINESQIKIERLFKKHMLLE